MFLLWQIFRKYSNRSIMFKIGSENIGEAPLFLAPMEDITDRSFRYICKKYGADVLTTEFVASEAIIRNVPSALKKMEFEEWERPIGIQIYGHQVDVMIEAAKIVASYNPNFIEINAGCPVRKIATRGAGAGLLLDIPKLIQIAEGIVKAVEPIPVSVKTRLGWDENSIVIDTLVEQLQYTGIQFITIHARTRNQFYKGKAQWQYIKTITSNPNVNIQIVGNGDISSPEIARDRLINYGVDALMIGRAAIGRPYIFREIKYFLQNGEKLPQLDINEIVEIAKEHFLKSLEIKGEPRGIYEMRRHFSLYFKGLPNFKPLRQKLVTSLNPNEILQILEYIREKYTSL